MKDILPIGSCPTDEDCAAVGHPDYEANARLECLRFIELLRKINGNEPEGAELLICANPHDFGTYYDVVCQFEDKDEEAKAYAYKVEANIPATWD
jgi:hypothetical protein